MEIINKENPLFCISVEDAQAEALEKLGRLLTEDELEKVKDGLEWGIGESIGIVYNAIFEDFRKKQ